MEQPIATGWSEGQTRIYPDATSSRDWQGRLTADVGTFTWSWELCHWENGAYLVVDRGTLAHGAPRQLAEAACDAAYAAACDAAYKAQATWTLCSDSKIATQRPGVTLVGSSGGYALFDTANFKADRLPDGFLWVDYLRLPAELRKLIKAKMDEDVRYHVGHWPAEPGPVMKQPGVGVVCTCKMCVPREGA